MNAIVVMPTYNEAENISGMLDAVLQQGLAILVVDDDSPDGTGDIVSARREQDERVHLLTGTKQGLGVAYMRGMQHAIQELGADVIIEMDADGSHDPDDLPRLLERIEDGADFVIGSRYVQGGQVNGWNAYRRLVSWGGNLVARMVSGLYAVHDCTAGFRAIRSSIIRTVDWESFPAKGYGFQIALLHHAKAAGARIEEIPVTFRDRERGTSKLGIADIVEFQFVALRLGWRTYDRLLKFLIVGATGLLVNLAIFSALYRGAGIHDVISQTIAVELSIVWNFLLHDNWTFRERKAHRALARWLRYNGVALVGLLVNVGTYAALTRYLGLFEELAVVLAIGVATALNFTLSTTWAWKQ